ncbi:MAG: DUF456 domain-containing protein [Bacteroidales bacterium]|nr:DUF456 domain-containing protein [Bacteroidales bacterium]MBQ7459057.1 DUF456 domain-containing protein [Bacteroidales bacterium]MBQ9529583.1 DUF456 domain-containing protein [Bacteroidales bacterium]
MWIDVIAVIIALAGIVGCFLPVIPGPPLSWGALLLLYFFGNGEMSLKFLLIWLGITIVVTILDYVVPAQFTRLTGGSKAAGRGSLVGLLLGLIFFPPWGMIAGAFLGALLAEVFINRSSVADSVKPALGSFAGFFFGTFIKLVACVLMMWQMFKFFN